LINNAEYHRDYLLAELQGRLDQIEFNRSKGLDPGQSEDDLALVKNEFQKLEASGIIGSFGDINKLSADQFNDAVYGKAKDLIARASEHYLASRNETAQQKDSRNNELIGLWKGSEGYIRMKDRYTNDRLDDILTNKQQVMGIIEWDGQLVRKVDPIYMEPSSRIGRAHFYAPHKKLGNLSIDTYWFNFIIIWLSTYVFYLTLVYNLLHKFTNWNRIRRLRKK
jgi:hypothetical protein